MLLHPSKPRIWILDQYLSINQMVPLTEGPVNQMPLYTCEWRWWQRHLASVVFRVDQFSIGDPLRFAFAVSDEATTCGSGTGGSSSPVGPANENMHWYFFYFFLFDRLPNSAVGILSFQPQVGLTQWERLPLMHWYYRKSNFYLPPRVTKS